MPDHAVFLSSVYHPENKASLSVPTYIQIAASFAATKLGLLAVRHPLHVVQTQKQATPNLSNWKIIEDIYRANGVRGFYHATPASILKILLAESYRGPLMVGVPGYVKSKLPENMNARYPIVTTLLSTPLISTLDAILICPILRIATYQLTDPNNRITLKESARCVNGIKGLYRGFSPLLLQTNYLWASFFFLDDLSRHMLQKYIGNISYSSLTAASVMNGAIQVTVNVVPDTIRVQMQKFNNQKLGFFATARQVMQTNGARALFSAAPHKIIGGIVGYWYKSMLRNYWMKKDDSLSKNAGNAPQIKRPS